jgi:hypothetical protein
MKAQNKRITQSDAKILEILKEQREVIFDARARSMGFCKWFESFRDSDDYMDYSAEERFKAADIYNKLSFLFEKIFNETELVKGLR